MKVIALLVFSLAVVVCEQQTLFAPHYTTYGGSWGVASKTSLQNSLRPAARVNRLAPVNSSYAKAAPPRNNIWVVDTGNGLTSSIGDNVDRDPGDNVNSTAPSGLDRPVFGPLDNGCPSCDFEDLFGLAGSAGPGGDGI